MERYLSKRTTLALSVPVLLAAPSKQHMVFTVRDSSINNKGSQINEGEGCDM
jgi:hypothetical protein